MSKSANMRKPPTPAEIAAEQDRLVAIDEAKAATVNLPTVVAPAQMPAVWSPANYVDQIAPQTLAGKLIKFGKDGRYLVPEDETEIGEDVQFIALVPETLIGWVKFNGPGNPFEKFMGLLYDGYRMPERSELGDLDESKWEMGLDGRPGDPWNHAIYLVLQRVDNSELFTFVAMSKTSRRAVGVLLRHFDRMQRTHPGYLPLVSLKVGGFQHRDPRVGFVKTPTIAAVGQIAGENAVKPAPADFNDDIPY